MSTSAYVQHTWATYEMITRDLLNHAEEGITANNTGVRALEAWKDQCDTTLTGTVTLTNTLSFPFNNSKQSVALSQSLNNANYEVVILSASAADGNIGDIEITERLVNGFKMAHTGSATSVTVQYAVIGGV